MKYLIKEIRMHSGLNQQKFAEALGASFTSINRWENGHSQPNKMTQKRLYQFCQDNKIPLESMIYKKIDKMTSSAADSGRTVLFHGSKSGLLGRLAPISRDKCDFGAGFYMGTNAQQPLTLISDFEKAKFYCVSIDMTELRILKVEPDIEWAMLVAYNRGKMDSARGTGIYDKYAHLADDSDLIIGSIANDRMFYVLDNFFQGNITDKALVMSLSALQLGKQYVAVSQKGCDAIRVENEIPLSYLEKQCLKDVSEENRIKGINLANQICRDYRREGLYFDELLDQTYEEKR